MAGMTCNGDRHQGDVVDGVRNFVEEGFGHDVRKVEVADWEVEASGGLNGGPRRCQIDW